MKATLFEAKLLKSRHKAVMIQHLHIRVHVYDVLLVLVPLDNGFSQQKYVVTVNLLHVD